MQIRCPECHSRISINPPPGATEATCTICESTIKLSQKNDKDNTRVIACNKCQTKLKVNLEKAGKSLKCPKCKAAINIDAQSSPPDPGKKGSKSRSPKGKQKKYDPRTVERKAYNAWAEMEESKRDNYYVAALKAIAYPFQTIGVVIFFVVGLPVGALLLDFVMTAVLNRFPTTGEVGSNYIAMVLVAVILLLAAAVMSIFAGFLFNIVRLAAVRSNSVPVIQGANHWVNLGAFVLWSALYFGPGVYLGFRAAGEGELFRLSGGSVILFIILGVLAPLNFLQVAMGGGTKSVDLGGLFRTLGKTFGDYCYLILLIVIYSAIFILVGTKFTSMAGNTPGFYQSTIYRFIGYGFYIFPFICMSRLIGLYAQYHEDKIPFALHGEQLSRQSVPAQIVLLVVLACLWMPFNSHAQQFAFDAGGVGQCAENLLQIKERSYTGRGFNWPKNEEELQDKFSSYCDCPASPDDGCGYEVYDFPAGVEIEDEYMVIFDKEGNHSDGSRNVIFANGHVQERISGARFEELMEMQEFLIENPDDVERDRRLRDMRFKRAMP